MNSTRGAGATGLYTGLWIQRVECNDERQITSMKPSITNPRKGVEGLSEVHGLKVSCRELHEFLDNEFGKTRKLIKCQAREDFIASDKRKQRLKKLFENREGMSKEDILKLNFDELSDPEGLKLETKVEMLLPKNSENTRMKEKEFMFEVCLGEQKYEVKAEFNLGASITVAADDSLGILK
eukprot:snap_masked-scaffold_70-processed-gene-0.14-mRNA-1 protein AED:1.00 eAED:1.00 QI:0/0/0/0/1/1/2/0/180